MEARLSSKQVLGLTPTHVITLKQVRHKKRSDNDKYTLEFDLWLYYALRVDNPQSNWPAKHYFYFIPIYIDASPFTNFIYFLLDVILCWRYINLLLE